MARGFFRQQGDVRPSEDDGFPARAKLRRQFISAAGRAGDDGHSDQIGIQILVDRLDSLVVEPHIVAPGRGNERRQRGQCQWLIAQGFFENAAARAVERAFW